MENETGSMPLVSILLAVYKPNKKWLEELLQSLNNQTYSTLELIIWDDCPEHNVDENIFNKNITNFPYRLYKGDENLGSDKVFERLTEIAQGVYVAYCDQDDIWLPEKISVCENTIIQEDAELVCSDLMVMNENGKIIANSMTKLRKRHIFYSGYKLAPRLMLDNFVMGCTILMKTSIAKKAIPFSKYYWHDGWLGLVAALNGKIISIKEPLLLYRRHQLNQTGLWHGIDCKDDYINKKSKHLYDRIRCLSNIPWLKKKLPEKEYSELLIWSKAKLEYLQKPNLADLRKIIKYKHYSLTRSFMDILLPFVPDFLFKGIISLYKNGRI